MTDWIAAVARRAQTEPADVAAVLASYAIEPGTSLGTPREMRLTRVAFDGEKQLHGASAPFEFEWHLGAGLSCIASDQNLVGKTSILEVIRWAIRGRSDLRADVQGWIRHAALDLEIGSVPYRIEFETGTGHPVGAITRTDTDARLAVFETHEAFEQSADAFFMDALALSPIQGWQGERGGDGRPTVHRWAAVSDVLRVTDGTLLLSSEAFGGINGRLLDLFTGLGWATTYQAARVAAQEEARRSGAEQRRREAILTVQSRRDQTLVAQLAEQRAALAVLPDELAWVVRAASVQQSAAGAEADLAARRRELLAAEAELAEARDARLLDARLLQQFEEADVAAAFFGSLDPHMCPRCDTAIGEDRRRRERSSRECAVCGESVANATSSEAELVDARRRARASASAELQAASRREQASNALEAARLAAEAARDALVALPEPPALVAARRELELDIARLEGRVAEGSEAVAEAIAPDPDGAYRRAIVEAAVREAEARLRAEEHEMFPQLDARILDLARRFGIRNAESVRLDAGGRLNLRTGGRSAPLSQLTPGERIRAKLAVVIALLQLARERGIGRHPGLVLVDSPASHEVNENDLGSMLAELNAVASATSGMQVLVTTRQRELASSLVPADRLRVPLQDGTMW